LPHHPSLFVVFWVNDHVQFFLDSDIGVFILEESRLDEAKQILAELKGE